MREGVAGTVRLIASRSKLEISKHVSNVGQKARVGALVLSLKLAHACHCKLEISLKLLL
jgi:hypothetical protein